MDLESGSGGSVSAAAIDSSNIGFQVLSLSPTIVYMKSQVMYRLFKFSSFILYTDFPFFSFWVVVFLKLLKKHGWREGTGLGVAEQVIN